MVFGFLFARFIWLERWYDDPLFWNYGFPIIVTILVLVLIYFMWQGASGKTAMIQDDHPK